MHYRSEILLILVLAFAGLAGFRVCGQQSGPPRGSIAFFDSLDRRIQHLEQQATRLKQTRDVTYLNLQRELDHTLFVKSYEKMIVDEDLDMAKNLVASKVEKAEFRKDQSSVKFFLQYQDNIYALIKQQRMHYQELFQKERNFKKEFDLYAAAGTQISYRKAQRMVSLALKYARENNLEETIQWLEGYEAYIQALIFDMESVYDLAELTCNARYFEKAFQPLVMSDSMPGIREAENLLSHCISYGKLTGSPLNGEYFKKKEMLLTSAISDLLDRAGREAELARYTDQSVVAQMDTINPCGVFKWHEQIVVIDEFLPSASMENVKKGEAIIHADKMLYTYLQKNKLCQSVNDLRFGYAYIIPYRSSAKNSAFYFNKSSEKWQFIACYTVVVSPAFTEEVSKFMPPLFFEDEMDMAVK